MLRSKTPNEIQSIEIDRDASLTHVLYHSTEHLDPYTYLALSLTAGEVDQIQLAHSDMIPSCIGLSALDYDSEDGVRPG